MVRHGNLGFLANYILDPHGLAVIIRGIYAGCAPQAPSLRKAKTIGKPFPYSAADASTQAYGAQTIASISAHSERAPVQ